MNNKVLFVLALTAASLVLDGCVVKAGPSFRRLADSQPAQSSPQLERQNDAVMEAAPAAADRT